MRYLLYIFSVVFFLGSCSVGMPMQEYSAYVAVTGNVAEAVGDKQYLIDGLVVSMIMDGKVVRSSFTVDGGKYYLGRKIDRLVLPVEIVVMVEDVDGENNGEYDTVVKHINCTSYSDFINGDVSEGYLGEAVFHLDFLLESSGGRTSDNEYE